MLFLIYKKEDPLIPFVKRVSYKKYNRRKRSGEVDAKK